MTCFWKLCWMWSNHQYLFECAMLSALFRRTSEKSFCFGKIQVRNHELLFFLIDSAVLWFQPDNLARRHFVNCHGIAAWRAPKATKLSGYKSLRCPGFNGFVLFVVGNVFIDNETSMVTSSISCFCPCGDFVNLVSMICRSSLRRYHRGSVYVLSFVRRGKCACIVLCN